LKLNEKALRDAVPKPGDTFQVFDSEVIGFAVRVQASDARTFSIDYRYAGRQRRMTIGRWPEWSPTTVREKLTWGLDAIGKHFDRSRIRRRRPPKSNANRKAIKRAPLQQLTT
jgi:hypothetical protein